MVVGMLVNILNISLHLYECTYIYIIVYYHTVCSYHDHIKMIVPSHDFHNFHSMIFLNIYIYISHMIHVWYIYLHLADCYTKNVGIYQHRGAYFDMSQGMEYFKLRDPQLKKKAKRLALGGSERPKQAAAWQLICRCFLFDGEQRSKTKQKTMWFPVDSRCFPCFFFQPTKTIIRYDKCTWNYLKLIVQICENML